MANRLENVDKVLRYADALIKSENYDGGVAVLLEAMKQLVFTLQGNEPIDYGDEVNICIKEDCCDGQDQQ